MSNVTHEEDDNKSEKSWKKWDQTQDDHATVLGSIEQVPRGHYGKKYARKYTPNELQRYWAGFIKAEFIKEKNFEGDRLFKALVAFFPWNGPSPKVNDGRIIARSKRGDLDNVTLEETLYNSKAIDLEPWIFHLQNIFFNQIEYKLIAGERSYMRAIALDGLTGLRLARTKTALFVAQYDEEDEFQAAEIFEESVEWARENNY